MGDIGLTCVVFSAAITGFSSRAGEKSRRRIKAWRGGYIKVTTDTPPHPDKVLVIMAARKVNKIPLLHYQRLSEQRFSSCLYLIHLADTLIAAQVLAQSSTPLNFHTTSSQDIRPKKL